MKKLIMLILMISMMLTIVAQEKTENLESLLKSTIYKDEINFYDTPLTDVLYNLSKISKISIFATQDLNDIPIELYLPGNISIREIIDTLTSIYGLTSVIENDNLIIKMPVEIKKDIVKKSKIMGRVTEIDEITGIEDVKLTIDEDTTKFFLTETGGVFIIDEIVVGTHVLKVEKNGYKPTTKLIDVKENSKKNVFIKLENINKKKEVVKKIDILDRQVRNEMVFKKVSLKKFVENLNKHSEIKFIFDDKATNPIINFHIKSSDTYRDIIKNFEEHIGAVIKLEDKYILSSNESKIKKVDLEQLNKGKIRGLIMDKKDKSIIEGAKVYLDEIESSKVMSGSEGKFKIENIPVDTYILNVSKDGYQDYSELVRIDLNVEKRLKIYIEKGKKNQLKKHEADIYSKLRNGAYPEDLSAEDITLREVCYLISKHGKINIAFSKSIENMKMDINFQKGENYDYIIDSILGEDLGVRIFKSNVVIYKLEIGLKISKINPIAIKNTCGKILKTFISDLSKKIKTNPIIRPNVVGKKGFTKNKLISLYSTLLITFSSSYIILSIFSKPNI